MRSKSKWTGIMIGVIFIGLQFTTSRHTNPTVDAAQTLEGTTAVPMGSIPVRDASNRTNELTTVEF